MEKRKLNWLIEEFSRDNSFLEIKEAAIKRGHNVKIVESIPFLYDPHWSLFDKGSCVVFLGSIQCAKQLQNAWKHHEWNPGVWCTWKNYNCSTFLAYWGDYALNHTYTLMPLLDFERKRNNKNVLECSFIRPNGGDKAFTGQVWSHDDLNSKLWSISTEDMNPDDLLLIAAPKNINREWRLVCSNKKVITGSRYKTAGMVDYRQEIPDEVKQFTEQIIQTDWQPDPIYVVDICSDFKNNLYLLEIGAFNVAGLYHCDFDLIVESVEQLINATRNLDY